MRLARGWFAAVALVVTACGGGSGSTKSDVSATGGTPCTPATCAALGATCGSVPDGCGDTLSCGSCTAPETCGGGGVANVCGAAASGGGTPAGDGGSGTGGNPTPVKSGETRWVRTIDGADPWGVGPGARDTAVLYAPGGGKDLVEWHDGAGAMIRATDLAVGTTGALVAGPDGALYVVVGANGRHPVSLLGETLTRPAVARFTSDGAPDRILFRCGWDDCGLLVKGIDGAGGVLVRESYLTWGTFRLLGPDGTERWSFDRNGHDAGDVASFGPAATLDSSGRLLLFARTIVEPATGTGTWHGLTLHRGGRAYVIATDRDGKGLWARELPGLSGSVAVLGTSSLGTVVGTGTFHDDFTFAGATLHGGEAGRFLLAIEADGSPRWLRSTAASTQLAVHPSGLVAATAECSSEHATVDAWNLAGDHLWTRSIPAPSCAHAWVATLANEDVLVGLHFEGTQDFGKGPVTAAQGGAAAFVALAP